MIFHILDNPHILKKIQSELDSVMRDPNLQPKWSELEQLPYLVRKSFLFYNNFREEDCILMKF